jgi:hypothetical protein
LPLHCVMMVRAFPKASKRYSPADRADCRKIPGVLFNGDMPARRLVAESWAVLMVEAMYEVDSYGEIPRKFGSGVGNPVHGGVFSQVDAVAAFRSCDVGPHRRRLVGLRRAGAPGAGVRGSGMLGS